ncbi:hypothetical protein RDI58_016634 [Solanum bulbocastanum]|uniref:Yippee domain-containing protein n=1 Tax=Solanum bulbocastanum TaxID=147425 RepID=A0AAN8YCM9_SOLBU
MAIRMGQNLPEYNHIPSVHYFYCCGCGTHVAIIYYIPTLRIIARVYICRDAVISWNNVTLFDFLYGGNNEQAPDDQDGGADEEQDRDADEQDLGANEQNVDQDGDTNEQDLGSNEQNIDLDGNGGINEQAPNQDTSTVQNQHITIEFILDEDKLTFSNHLPLVRLILQANEENADQDGDANERVPNEQEVGAI